MKQSVRVFMGTLFVALMTAGVTATPVLAQEKAAKAAVTPKMLLENAKVKVYEVTYKPGAENTTIAASANRIVRAIKGGTLDRTYADGKKETTTWKAGEVKYLEAGQAYSTKNNGKTEVQLYVVQLK
jgi:glyoxylate utilization-related uncharacterized protein